MDKNNGTVLSEIDHIRQSIQDILITPVGSRVMRRNYGSHLFELIDEPLNHQTFLKLSVLSVQAIEQWEQRVKVHKAQVEVLNNKVCLTLEIVHKKTNQTHRLTPIALR